MSQHPKVRELRLVVTTDDYDAAVTFYRDELAQAEHVAVEGDRIVVVLGGDDEPELADHFSSAFATRVPDPAPSPGPGCVDAPMCHSRLTSVACPGRPGRGRQIRFWSSAVEPA